jgi:adenylate cyclase class 1
MEELTRRGLQLLSNKTDALDYGTQHINLAIQFDLIQLNSWGEIVVSHYSQQHALPDALMIWHASLPEKAQQRPQLYVKSYSVTRPESISRRVYDLWTAFTDAWYSYHHDGNLRYIFKLAEKYCMIESIDHQASVKYLDTKAAVCQQLEQETSNFMPAQFDVEAFQDSPLPMMYKQNTMGAIELFYYVEHDQAQVWILDEAGVLFHQQQSFYDHNSMLNHYFRFFQSIMIRRQAQQSDHVQDLKVRLFQIGRSKGQGTWQIRNERTLDERRLSHYFNIQVIASEGIGDKPMYTFFCNNEEISPLEYGDQVLSAVARLILRRRSNIERYPAYITDLDISSLNNISQGTASHLGMKKFLEEALYQELSKA